MIERDKPSSPHRPVLHQGRILELGPGIRAAPFSP